MSAEIWHSGLQQVFYADYCQLQAALLVSVHDPWKGCLTTFVAKQARRNSFSVNELALKTLKYRNGTMAGRVLHVTCHRLPPPLAFAGAQ